MQAEAQAEAEALIAAAEAKNEAAQRKYKELLADIAAQRKALEAEYEETKTKQDAELATMRAETQSAIAAGRKRSRWEKARLSLVMPIGVIDTPAANDDHRCSPPRR